MTARFSRIEYWLLESVVEYAEPLRILASEELGVILNKSVHGAGRDELVETLDRLIQGGLIEGWLVERLTGAGQPTFPDRNELARLVSSESQEPMCYRLTRKGGAAWEEFARPNWERFVVEDGGSYDAPQEWEDVTMVCANKGFLRRFFDCWKDVDGDCLDVHSVEWEMISPWEATYWKVVPFGHQLSFRCRTEVQERTPGRARTESHYVLQEMRASWYAWRS